MAVGVDGLPDRGAVAPRRREPVAPALRYGPMLPTPGGGWGPRNIVHYELMLVSRGSTRSTIDGRAWDPVGPSEAILLFPGQVILHEFDADADQNTEAWWVHVPPSDVSPDLAGRLASVPQVLPLSDQMFRIAMSMMRLKASTLSTVGEMARHAAAELLWCYVGDAERMNARASRAGSPDTIERAQAFIREHLDEPLSLETIAAAAGSSQTNLIRLFHAHIGETPMAYVWHQRVARGIRLLDETGLGVAQIAERAGFRTAYHFSRTIKAHLGMTPTEVRQRAWGPGGEGVIGN